MGILRFHILNKSGWIGTGSRPPTSNRATRRQDVLMPIGYAKSSRITTEQLKVLRKDLDKAGMLMPPVNIAPESEEPEATLIEQITRREFASDDGKLLPPGVGREAS